MFLLLVILLHETFLLDWERFFVSQDKIDAYICIGKIKKRKINGSIARKFDNSKPKNSNNLIP